MVESDSPKNLTELSLAEDEVEARHTQQNKTTNVSKEQDGKYKEQVSSGLRKSVGELNSDRNSTNAGLYAVGKYLVKLNEMCVPKRRRAARRRKGVPLKLQGSRRLCPSFLRARFCNSTKHSIV